jgi:hypothetical protein
MYLPQVLAHNQQPPQVEHNQHRQQAEHNQLPPQVEQQPQPQILVRSLQMQWPKYKKFVAVIEQVLFNTVLLNYNHWLQ